MELHFSQNILQKDAFNVNLPLKQHENQQSPLESKRFTDAHKEFCIQ